MRIALLALSLGVLPSACVRRFGQSDAPASFNFLTRSPTATLGGEVWEAIAAAPDDTIRSGPATFRVYLERPGRQGPAGSVVRGVLRRGDPGGYRWFLISFGPVFEPAAGTGGMQLEMVDSVPVTIKVGPRTTGTWSGTVQLPNGAKFMIALDSAGRRGAFSRNDSADNAKVLGAIAGLVVPRDGAVGVPDQSPNER